MYKVEKGIIYSEGGLPHAPRWFCDGRVAFQADNEGLCDVDFFNPKANWSYKLFHKRFWGGMRFYSVSDGGRRYIRPEKCELLPFGYKSEGKYGTFCAYTANDSLYFLFTPTNDCDFEIQFYDEYLFVPDNSSKPDLRYRGTPRKWGELQLENNILSVKYTENENDTAVVFSSDKEISLKRLKDKYIVTLSGLSAGKETCCAVCFCPEEIKTYENYKDIISAQFERYANVAEKAPVLQSGHKYLDSFFALAPMYHESLKTTDIKGALRAQSSHYWVWGWDSMTSNNACFYWGDADFIGEMLECMKKYSTESGIEHAFGYDMSPGGKAAPPAQGMYITMLENYMLSGGDYKKYYDFAKFIFGLIADTEVEKTGLCSGTSLYPDFRDLIHETGRDISAFNNTVSYCAIRSMQRLAAACGDKETEKTARDFGDRMKENFNRALFNERLGFYDSSADIDGYEKRNVPSNNAIKWESNDCFDLVEVHLDDCCKFYRRHLVSAAGLRPLPEWSDCYDADSNQLHCWWPVMSEFFIRAVNKANDVSLMEKYIGWIEYWTEKLMCPEGISCYYNDENVPLDNWNAMSGIWQGYNIRGFYNAVIHGIVGIDFDCRGLNIYPNSADEISIKNLHFGKRRLSVKMCGGGKNVKSVVLNGEDLGSVSTMPYDRLKEDNEIIVTRC